MAAANCSHYHRLLSSPSATRFTPVPSLLSHPKPQQLRRISTSSNPRRSSSLFSVRSVAVDGNWAAVKRGVPRSVPVQLARELLLAGHRYLDVRTEDEFTAGHVEGAVNIPYMFKTGAGMMRNPYFVLQVASVFGKDDEIIIGCRSGERSLMAAADLIASGFTGITDIAGGFSAWVQIGLPMDQYF